MVSIWLTSSMPENDDCHEEESDVRLENSSFTHSAARLGVPHMHVSRLRLPVVVPTFNELHNIKELLCRLEAALGATGWEVVFVDDDSSDGTATEVRNIAQADPRVHCVQRVGRQGLSSACIEGMLATSRPHYCHYRCRFTAVLPKILAQIEGGADLVIGTRYADGGSTGNWDVSRKTMSRLATRMSRVVPRHEGAY
jgi:dolichol-phosphate mannosyltransferase